VLRPELMQRIHSARPVAAGCWVDLRRQRRVSVGWVGGTAGGWAAKLTHGSKAIATSNARNKVQAQPIIDCSSARLHPQRGAKLPKGKPVRLRLQGRPRERQRQSRFLAGVVQGMFRSSACRTALAHAFMQASTLQPATEPSNTLPASRSTFATAKVSEQDTCRK